MGFEQRNDSLRIMVPVDGPVWRHAAFYTALWSLCGIPLTELKGRPGRGSNVPPDCAECLEVAAAWDPVDRCAPASWFRTRVCRGCGEKWTPQRRDAKACSARCRERVNRADRRLAA